MKIIYSGIRFENYDLKRPSFEYSNFYLTLKNMPGVEVIECPYDDILKVGRKKFNSDLLDLVKYEKPDLFFAFMFTDELDIGVLKEIKRLTISVGWFPDDHWRIYNYSRVYAPHFTWGLTTWSKAPEIYLRLGIKNVIRSQWAANIAIYKPSSGGTSGPEVSFVGSWTRPRVDLISVLKSKGIKVEVYGFGWPQGRISDEELVKVFSSSKINLGLNPAPGHWNINSLGRLFMRRSVDRMVPDFRFGANLQSFFNRNIPQIKARHFEIPACGGFLLTAPADDLESYYQIGEEIALYDGTPDDLVRKINYYLAYDGERTKIARAGYKRTLAEHTYQERFRDILRRIGFLKDA